MTKTVLHVGCGGQHLDDFLEGYQEIRLDIDPDAHPDIVASLLDMGDIGHFDAIYGSHVLEHFAPHEVAKVVSEFYRVLKPKGFVIMIVPNLEYVRPTDEVVYDSPAGPITGLDMYYGKASMVAENPYMAHKAGFVRKTLAKAFGGFSQVVVKDLTNFNLMVVATKGE